MRHLLAVLSVAALLTGCSGDAGGSLVEESTTRADAACACEEFGCTTDEVAWFNRVSISQESDLDALSTADRETYTANSLRAADCQNELR
jgi:hypothetical protein